MVRALHFPWFDGFSVLANAMIVAGYSGLRTMFDAGSARWTLSGRHGSSGQLAALLFASA